jgi:hypothetical protein
MPETAHDDVHVLAPAEQGPSYSDGEQWPQNPIDDWDQQDE